jgi:small subunit ribosomal protein S3Ae
MVVGYALSGTHARTHRAAAALFLLAKRKKIDFLLSPFRKSKKAAGAGGAAKKGGKKKLVDPFTKKDWYTVKAPNAFKHRDVGFTLVNRTAGLRIAADGLKGRVFEACLADLQKDEDQAHRKIKLRCEDVHGKDVITTFHGMDLTTDKLRSLIRKFQSLVEVAVEVKTVDGFKLRLFIIAFTKRRPNQVKSTSYATSSQQRKLRRKITRIVRRETNGASVKDIVAKLIPESIGKQIEKECQGVYPLKDVYVRKVKTIFAPKYDAVRINESHREIKQASATEDIGLKLAQEAVAASNASAPVVGESK